MYKLLWRERWPDAPTTHHFCIIPWTERSSLVDGTSKCLQNRGANNSNVGEAVHNPVVAGNVSLSHHGMSRANSIKSRCIPYRHAQHQRHVSKILWGNGDAKEHGYQPPYTCWRYTNGVTHAWRISLQLPIDDTLWFYGWNNGLMRVGIGQEHIGRSDGEEKLTPRVHQGQQRVRREATIPVKQEKLVQTGQNVP